MRYFGSKVSSLGSICNIIAKEIPSGTICDPFGGIGTVGSFFKTKGYSVWSGDILTFAYYFQIARVARNRMPTFKILLKVLKLESVNQLIYHLNRKRITHGWLLREYSEKRRFFTKENASRIEVCRTLFTKWSDADLLTHSERAMLLASLINSIDKVANTAGTYYAYLKEWNRKALRPFHFQLIPCTRGNADCHCFLAKADELVTKRDFDILYLDPPYNDRSYSQYYHLPESIAMQETPKTHGKSGMPDNARASSEFNRFGGASKALERLLARSRFRLAVFHYSDNGILTTKQIRDILTAYGRIKEYYIDSQGYTTSKARRIIKHHVYVVKHA